MTPEQLQAALNALMEAGLDGDALAAATKALTDAFSSTAEVTDDQAVDAMDPGMSASFRAADTSDEDKATLLESGRFQARRTLVAVALAAAKAAPAKESPKDAPLTVANFRAAIKEEVTKAMPGQGRQVEVKGNPVKDKLAVGAAGFSAKIDATMKASGVNKAQAIQILAQTDRPGFNEWQKAGRPAAE